MRVLGRGGSNYVHLRRGCVTTHQKQGCYEHRCAETHDIVTATYIISNQNATPLAADEDPISEASVFSTLPVYGHRMRK